MQEKNHEKKLDYEISLLKRMVAIDTDSAEKRNYAKFASLLVREAKKFGFSARVVSAISPDGKKCPSVIIGMKNRAKETLLVVPHYDIVAPGKGWKTSPFKLARKKGKLIGRGAADDKGAIAAAFGAMRDLRNEKGLKRKIKLAVCCDEESGGEFGAKFLVKNHRKLLRADAILIADGSIKRAGIGCSGTVGGFLHFKGKQGHAAYPHKVPNIIHNALPFLTELRNYAKVRARHVSKLPAPEKVPTGKIRGRFSITILQAGFKTNVIPAELAVGFDLRALPEEDVGAAKREFTGFVKKLLKKHRLKAGIEIKASSGYYVKPNTVFVKEAKAAAEKAFGRRIPVAATLGAEDGRYFVRLGKPLTVLTPGGKNAHGIGEYLSERNLRTSKEILKALCR